MPKRFLLRHVGNMGDLVFFVPPVLETIKRRYPDSHITFVTAWGFRNKRSQWGQRNQGGFCISLLMTNPHVDQLVHYDDRRVSLSGDICQEEGHRFPTWSAAYYEEQKKVGGYDVVCELDFGLSITDNPIQRMYDALGLPEETQSAYQLYLTESDRAVARWVMAEYPRPRIVLLEGLDGRTTRGWDPDKVPALTQAIRSTYGVYPVWFGAKHTPEYHGRPLTLRENIATLEGADVAIGVLSGPLHFAAAVGTPTITLYADQPIHRAAPAYFLNGAIADPKRRHRTLLGPQPSPFTLLKGEEAPKALTSAERSVQGYRSWVEPGRQSTKAAVAPLTVDEVMSVLHDMLQ